MISTTINKRKEERGNALFLILIAVALFAALSYAVTQSGRGSGSLSRETGMIDASQLTQYPASVRTAVTRMVLTGTVVTDVDFAATPTGEARDNIFDSTGGGVVSQDPPATAVVAGETASATAAGEDWRYKPVYTDTGYFIDGIGTAAGKESFAFVGVNEDTCIAINRGLKGQGADPTPADENGQTFVASAPTTPADEPQAGAAPAGAAGQASATAGSGAAAIGKGDSGLAFACVSNHASADTGPWIYYHALIEQ